MHLKMNLLSCRVSVNAQMAVFTAVKIFKCFHMLTNSAMNYIQISRLMGSAFMYSF